jgi:transcriptional regulator with XRE-family HTH domain
MARELKQSIRKIRELNNLTQEEVDSKCGMSASASGQIARNPTKSSLQEMIINALLWILD